MKNKALGIIEERKMKEYFNDGKSEALLDEMNNCVSSLGNGGWKDAEKAYSTILRDVPSGYVAKCIENVNEYITLRNKATEGMKLWAYTGKGSFEMTKSIKEIFDNIDKNSWDLYLGAFQEHMRNHVGTVNKELRGCDDPFIQCAGYVVYGYEILSKELPPEIAKDKFKDLNKRCPPKGPWVTNQREKAWEIIAEFYKGLFEEKISKEKCY